LLHVFLPFFVEPSRIWIFGERQEQISRHQIRGVLLPKRNIGRILAKGENGSKYFIESRKVPKNYHKF